MRNYHFRNRRKNTAYNRGNELNSSKGDLTNRFKGNANDGYAFSLFVFLKIARKTQPIIEGKSN